jgi:hypothetical protein
MAVWLDGRWMFCRLVGFLVRSLVFFFLCFCFSFASLRGLKSKRSVVIVGRICPLVDVEAGFIILNLKITVSPGDWSIRHLTRPLGHCGRGRLGRPLPARVLLATSKMHVRHTYLKIIITEKYIYIVSHVCVARV